MFERSMRSSTPIARVVASLLAVLVLLFAGSVRAQDSPRVGVKIRTLTAELRKQHKLSEDVKGALVTQVSPDSACADADVRPGDVIVDIDGKRVASADEAVKLSEEVKTKSSVRLRIARKGATQFVVVEEKKDN